jgi:hypothetical protein
VTLNATLHDALIGSAGGSETLNITWEEVMQRCLSRMTQTYHLTATGPLTQPKPVKLEPIDIRVSMRSGNKKVWQYAGWGILDDCFAGNRRFF